MDELFEDEPFRAQFSRTEAKSARETYHAAPKSRGGRGRPVRNPTAYSQRVTVKSSINKLGSNGLAKSRAHLSYLQRDGVGPDGEPTQLFGTDEDGRKA